MTGPELRSRLAFCEFDVRRVNLLAAPRDILRINPGPLFGFGMTVSPGYELLTPSGIAIVLSPRSKVGTDVGGRVELAARAESRGARKGVPEGLESFDGLAEFGVEVYEEA